MGLEKVMSYLGDTKRQRWNLHQDRHLLMQVELARRRIQLFSQELIQRWMKGWPGREETFYDDGRNDSRCEI
jgi:hypothetical protein